MSERSALVLVGGHVRLDRPGLRDPAPGTVENLLTLCRGWAAEVGWSLAGSLAEANAIVVGPGITPPPVDVPVGQVRPGTGIDGFRWALRHVAFTTQWPPRTAPYGHHPDHVADLRRPQTPGPHPVALLLHGGFWADAWRRELMDGLAIDLAQRGWATCNVEYRRVGAGGGWPATGSDVLAAIDTVESLPDVTDELLVVGHSAGAQLALWAAGERRARVTRVVSLAGLCDLESAARQRLGGGATDRLLDGEPAATASPIDRLPIGVPTVVAHAAGDSVVPADQSRRYAAAAAAAGDDVQLVEVPGDDHMSLIEPDGDWPVVAQHLELAPPV